jgi:hypothetical protein
LVAVTFLSSVLLALQEHGETRKFELPSTAKQLHAELRKILIDAHNQTKIRTSPADILKFLKLGPPPPTLLSTPAVRGDVRNVYCINGGEKNFDRSDQRNHFRRKDGAWFDFQMTVRESQDALEILAIDFEIRLPPGFGLPFVRFDCNLPGHTNESKALRSHVHPGHDDLQLPAPFMSPLEVLHLFIEHLRLPEKSRTPSVFEMQWLLDTVKLHPSDPAAK